MTYNQILKYFGGVRPTARALNISAASVCAWKDTGVPALRQYQIDHITHGALQVNQSVLPDSKAKKDK
jgi:hypothetical protein